MAKQKQTKAEATIEIERAEKALVAAKRNHREAFRIAVFDVYQAYGLCITSVAEEAVRITALENATIDQVVPK
jgi:hypothetical protein